MNEAVAAHRLFREAQALAFRLGIDRINCLKIRLGAGSGLDKGMLRYSLVEYIFPETIAEDAEVEIMLEPLIAKCTKCHKEIAQLAPGGGCPVCGSKDLDIVGGTDVAVEGVE